MDLSESRAKYDQWHDKLGLDADDASAPWHQMAKQHLKQLQNKRVLEIGCGRGGFSEYLARFGANLTSADFSPVAVRIAEKRLKDFDNCELITADVQNVPFPNKTFDIVISMETLEHVPDPDLGLKELARVTKSGGQLIISTPNYFGLLGIYRAYREMTRKGYTEVGQPINHPIKVSERIRKLKSLGCSVTFVDGCGHYLYLPGKLPIRMKWLDHPRQLTKWLAAHSLTIATKP
jgi:ubiquinone/menaquinone biosynthesis C-methylase UbiE